MKQNTKFLLIFSLSIYFLFPTFVKAEEGQDNPKPMLLKGLKAETKRDLNQASSEPKERMNLVKTFKEENTGAKTCTETKAMIDKRLSLMQVNLSKRKALVTRVNTVLEKKIEYLKAKNLDTSKIEASLQTYTDSMNSLFAQREALVSSLSALTNFDCTSDPAGFKTNLKQFNQNFKNQNLDFNQLNKDLRVKVLYEISNLINQKQANNSSQGGSQ